MDNFQDYEHQVGGWHNGSASHILKDSKGHILKPIKLNANPTYETPTKEKDFPFKEKSETENNTHELVPVCRDERQFYERVKNSTHPDDISLLPLMPRFYGSVDVDENGKTPFPLNSPHPPFVLPPLPPSQPLTTRGVQFASSSSSLSFSPLEFLLSSPSFLSVHGTYWLFSLPLLIPSHAKTQGEDPLKESQSIQNREEPRHRNSSHPKPEEETPSQKASHPKPEEETPSQEQPAIQNPRRRPRHRNSQPSKTRGGDPLTGTASHPKPEEETPSQEQPATKTEEETPSQEQHHLITCEGQNGAPLSDAIAHLPPVDAMMRLRQMRGSRCERRVSTSSFC
ncbi:hypothetical protein C7M84_004806 [Penaeus vannamei]|uniref:Uncharacterized protein n=1 Tax=Penaeus vannamei TaxID=6689 RepID=A0A3R7QEW9_PENVA|nr:hypothetical protein C7M84_004806 [Penaeus vannamei]